MNNLFCLSSIKLQEKFLLRAEVCYQSIGCQNYVWNDVNDHGMQLISRPSPSVQIWSCLVTITCDVLCYVLVLDLLQILILITNFNAQF